MTYFHFFLLFAAIPLYGQFEWVGDYGFSSTATGFLKTSSGQFIVVRNAQDKAGFSVLDSAGAMVFNYSDPYSLNAPPSEGQGYSIFLDFMEMPDSSYIFLISDQVCFEPLGGGFERKLKKFDKEWNESTLAAIWDYPWEYCAAFPDGSFALATFDKVQRRNADGDPIWTSLSLGGGESSDMAVTEGSTVVLATENGVLVLDENGNVDSLYENLIFQKIKITPGNILMAIRADSFFVYSPDFEPIFSIGFAGEDIQDFNVYNDKLAILTASKNVYIYDLPSFSLTNEFFAKEVNPDGSYIEVVADGVVIASSECTPNGSCAPFLKKYPFDGDAPDLSRDAGVTFIDPTSTANEYLTADGDYLWRYDALKITVSNFGNSPIDNVKLNARFENIWIGPTCKWFYQQYHKKFTDLSLMPGESIDLYWDNFGILFYGKPSEPFDICIWTSLPNQGLDSDHDNDRFCSSFLVNDEEPAVAFGFNIYPNPSSFGSTIAYDLPTGSTARIRVFNNMGILMESHQIVNNDGTLALGKYPAGLYYVVLEMDGQPREVLKFVQL